MSVPVTRPTTVMAGATLVESKDGFPAIYKIQQTVLSESKPKAGVGCVRKVLVGQENPEARRKRDLNVLIVGATGSGKTTLLNGFANYLHCVKFEDTFRYKLVVESDEGGPKRTGNQAHSQTDSVTAYRFDWQPWFPVPYNVVLVDTPGFGDTRGVEVDEATVKKIEELFRSKTTGIDSLRAVAFVVPASTARLSVKERYIFESVQSLFGNDVKDNFAIMATFADTNTGPVKNAVKEASIEIREFFRFNNCALFCPNTSNDVDDEEEDGEDLNKGFWKILCTSYRRFFSAVQKFPEISLTKSRDVLQRRQGLKDTLDLLNRKIQEAVDMQSEQMELKKLLEKHEHEMNINRYKIVTRKVGYWHNEQLPKGHFATTCGVCQNMTCHDDCCIDDAHKYNCCAMNGEYCKVCGCHWTKHCNRPWIWVRKYREEKESVEDLMNRAYVLAKDGSIDTKASLKQLETRWRQAWDQAYKYLKQYQECLAELNRIALISEKKSEVEYLNNLIRVEENQKPDGWQSRTTFYRQAIKLAERSAEVSSARDLDRLMRQWFGSFF